MHAASAMFTTETRRCSGTARLRAPKRHLVVFDAVEGRVHGDAALAVFPGPHCPRSNQGAQLVGRIDGRCPYPADGFPVASWDEFGQIHLAHHGWHHVGKLKMEVAAGPVETGITAMHCAVLQVRLAARTHLQSWLSWRWHTLIGVFCSYEVRAAGHLTHGLQGVSG